MSKLKYKVHHKILGGGGVEGKKKPRPNRGEAFLHPILY